MPMTFTEENHMLQSTNSLQATFNYAMYAYKLVHSFKHGTVSRGVCEVENGFLTKLTKIHPLAG